MITIFLAVYDSIKIEQQWLDHSTSKSFSVICKGMMRAACNIKRHFGIK
jgi:hypothetical protein